MKKMLMIVDPQVDFITGSLPVPGAAAAMDALAEYVAQHGPEYAHIVVTSDFHPADHCSFECNGGQWPIHCVAGTEGAEIWKPLAKALERLPVPVSIVYKGGLPDHEEYSVFANGNAFMTIKQLVTREGIEGIDICGLAGDICVAQSMADGREIYGDDFFNLLPEYSPTIG